MKTKYIFLVISILSIFTSCNLKNKKLFEKQIEKISVLTVPIKFDKYFAESIFFDVPLDTQFIQTFLNEKYPNADYEVRYFGGYWYDLSENLKVIIWKIGFGDGDIIQMQTFYKFKPVDTLDIAGLCCDSKYSCEIDKDFNFTITEETFTDEGLQKIIKKYTVDEKGNFEIFDEQSKYIIIENLNELFKKEIFPYYSNLLSKNKNLNEIPQEFLSILKEKDKTGELFSDDFLYYTNSFFELPNNIQVYTFILQPKLLDFNQSLDAEYIFIMKNGYFVSKHELSSHNIEYILNSEIVYTNNNLYIIYELTEFLKTNNYSRIYNNEISFYNINEYFDLILCELSDIFNKNSLEYTYFLSKQKQKIDFDNFKKYCKIFEDNSAWENYNLDVLEIKTFSYIPVNDTVSAFFYYIYDDMQNTFVCNLFDKNKKLIKYEIIEDCINPICSNFKTSEIYYKNNKVIRIYSENASDGIPKNIYVFLNQNNIEKISSSANGYEQYTGNQSFEYIYNLIDDDELEGILINLDVKKLLKDLKAVKPSNPVLEKNIQILSEN